MSNYLTNGIADDRPLDSFDRDNGEAILLYAVNLQKPGFASAVSLDKLDVSLLSREGRAPADDGSYNTSGNGTAIALAPGTVYVELTAIGSELWFRFGGNTVVAAAPTVSAAFGVPRYLPQGQSIIVDARNATSYAVSSTGAFALAWWLL